MFKIASVVCVNNPWTTFVDMIDMIICDTSTEHPYQAQQQNWERIKVRNSNLLLLTDIYGEIHFPTVFATNVLDMWGKILFYINRHTKLICWSVAVHIIVWPPKDIKIINTTYHNILCHWNHCKHITYYHLQILAIGHCL